jgi:dihydrofolate reductase
MGRRATVPRPGFRPKAPSRSPLTMVGGTVFHFVTESIHGARERAIAAAGGKDVRVSGGISTVQQYLQAGPIDDLHLVVSQVLLGAGENLFRDLDLPRLGYQCMKPMTGERATHVFLSRRLIAKCHRFGRPA